MRTEAADYQCLDRKQVFQTRIFSVDEDLLLLPTGATATRVSVRHPGAVIVLPQANDGSLLLVRQYRHAVGKMLLEFPAGTLEQGEDPLICAKRELAEEIHHNALTWTSIGTFLPAPGFVDEIEYGFFAKDLYPEKRPHDADEIIEIVPMLPSDFEKACARGDIPDNKSIALYFRAKLIGLFIS